MSQQPRHFLASPLPIDVLVRRLVPLFARRSPAPFTSHHGIVLLVEPGLHHAEMDAVALRDNGEYYRSLLAFEPHHHAEIVDNPAERMALLLGDHQDQFPDDLSFGGVTFGCQFCTGVNHIPEAPRTVATAAADAGGGGGGGDDDDDDGVAAERTGLLRGMTAEQVAALLVPEFTRQEYKILRGPLEVLEHCRSPAHLARRRERILAGSCTVVINGRPLVVDAHCLFPERIFGPGVLLFDETLGAFLTPDPTGAVSIAAGRSYSLARFALRHSDGGEERCPAGFPTRLSARGSDRSQLSAVFGGGSVKERRRRRRQRAEDGHDNDRDHDDEEAGQDRQLSERHFTLHRDARSSALVQNAHVTRKERQALRTVLGVHETDLPSRANVRALRYELECARTRRAVSRFALRTAAATAASAASASANSLLCATRLGRLGDGEAAFAHRRIEQEQQAGTAGHADALESFGPHSLRYARASFARVRMTEPAAAPTNQAEALNAVAGAQRRWQRRASLKRALRTLEAPRTSEKRRVDDGRR